MEEVPPQSWYDHIQQQPPQGEAYIVLRVEKRLVSHFTMLQALRRTLRLRKEADLGFAGIKDKHAVTVQYATIPYSRWRNDLLQEEHTITLGDGWIRVRRIGYHTHRLTIGKLKGNTFMIRLRGMDPVEKESVHKKAQMSRQGELVFPNYFGDQRFGIHAGVHNAWIGYAFLLRDWKRALHLLVKNEHEDPALAVLRRAEELPHDALTWIKRVSRRKRLLYVSSLQSLLSNILLQFLTRIINEHGWMSEEEVASQSAFLLREAYGSMKGALLLERLIRDDTQRVFLNAMRVQEALDMRLREKVFTLTTSLPGFDAPLTEGEEWLLQQLGLKRDDFILRQMPDLPAPGGRRSAFNRIHQFTYVEEDTSTLRVSFTLRTGSYATIAVDQLISGG